MFWDKKKEPSEFAKSVAELLKNPEEWQLSSTDSGKTMLIHKPSRPNNLNLVKFTDGWNYGWYVKERPNGNWTTFGEPDQDLICKAIDKFYALRVANASNQAALRIWADWLEEHEFPDAAKALRERFKN